VNPLPPPHPAGRVPALERLRDLWRCVTAPTSGFARRAAQAPGLGPAARNLVAVRTLPALAGLVLGYLGLVRTWEGIAQARGPVWDLLWERLPEGFDAAGLRAALAGLPPAPAWWRVLPWLALLAPLGVLGIWLHDAVWDHMALWLLRGLARPRSFRATLVADAEALTVGVFGALAGLLKHLGLALAVLLWPVAVYFWILRGYALAAWHGCPAWKGVLATLLHAAAMGLLVLGLVAALAALVFAELRLG
jgi:hypothetical protein